MTLNVRMNLPAVRCSEETDPSRETAEEPTAT